MNEKCNNQDMLLTDEELDSISGGAGTSYFSQPYVNAAGQNVFDVVTVSGGMTYNPATGFGGDNGSRSHMCGPAERMDALKARHTGRGNTIIDLDIAGPLKH